MKSLILLSLIFFFNTYSLEMKPGLWEYETEMTGNPQMKMMMDKLKSMPPAQREMVKKMIEQKMGGPVGFSDKGTVTTKCLTNDDIAKMESMIKKDIVKDGCKFKVTKSSKTVLKGNMECEDEKKNVKISLKMDSSKSGTNELISAMSTKPVKTTMKWKSAKCSKAKEKTKNKKLE